MKNTKHTQGPWEADMFDITAAGKSGELVASVLNADTRREGMANAKLIAAAPELLEALREVLQWSANNWSDRQSNEFRELNKAVDKAIKKATD